MITEMQEYVSEQTQALAARARKFGKAPIKSARAVAVDSAERIQSMKSPVRAIARAGVKLADVSQTAVTSLIQLESEMLTAAMTDLAERLNQAAHADGLKKLVREQAEAFEGTGERLVGDATRAVEIVTDAGHDIRKLVMHTYENVVKAGEGEHVTKPRARKAGRVVRKAAAKPTARKVAARRRKTAAKRPLPASRWAM